MSRHQGCESISIKWLTPDVWRPPKVNHSTICYMTTLSIFCERNMYSCTNKYDLEVRGPRLCFHQLAWMCLCVGLCGLLPCILSAGWAACLCLLGPGVSTAISLPSTLCGDSCSEWMSYLSTILQILLSLPTSLTASFPDMETWTSQLSNYYNVLKIAGIYVFDACSSGCLTGCPVYPTLLGYIWRYVSLMYTHQGCLIEHPVYPTLMGYADKSTKWIPLNIAAKEPWTGSQGLPMTQAVGEVHRVTMCGASWNQQEAGHHGWG